MMSKGVDWTPQIDDLLRRLYMGRLTFRDIATRMNEELGLSLTRNACIGRARRLKFQLRNGAFPKSPKPPKPRKRSRKQVKVQTEPVSAHLHLAPPLVPGALTMLQLTSGTCRWPSGDRPPYTYCGAPVHDDRPFCLAHCQLAYDKPKKVWS